MKKLMLVLAITGVLISCSSKEEAVKKDPATTQVEAPAPTEAVTAEETTEVSVEPVAVTDAEYKDVSEPVAKTPKKEAKPATKPAPKPKKVAVKETKKEVVAPTTDSSIDKAVDKDVDKKIAKVETETKDVKVEDTPVEESSNKTLFGILGALVVAAGAFFVFKKK
jgi:hypothetical protein